jgi:nucleoside phosphorylase
MDTSPIIVCFALRQEAKGLAEGGGWRKLITGMGRRNAEASIRGALAATRPRLVITAGFAGGLNPALRFGTVLFDEDEATGLGSKLLKAGAVRARFHCADRVAATIAEKERLWKSTGADAVEMESQGIRAVCRENKISSATVRVISDAADEDLPMDFNLLMTPDYRMSSTKLARALITAPGKIPELLAFQSRLSMAQKGLVEALMPLLSG